MAMVLWCGRKSVVVGRLVAAAAQLAPPLMIFHTNGIAGVEAGDADDLGVRRRHADALDEGERQLRRRRAGEGGAAALEQTSAGAAGVAADPDVVAHAVDEERVDVVGRDGAADLRPRGGAGRQPPHAAHVVERRDVDVARGVDAEAGGARGGQPGPRGVAARVPADARRRPPTRRRSASTSPSTPCSPWPGRRRCASASRRPPRCSRCWPGSSCRRRRC